MITSENISKKNWHFTMHISVFILIVLIFPIEGLYSISPKIYSWIWGYGRYFAYYVIVLMYIINNRNIELENNKDIVLVILAGFLFALTLIKGGAVNEWFAEYGTSIIVLLMLTWLRNRIPELLKLINIYLVVVCILNLYCMLKWPNGMYYSEKTGYTRNWIMGYKSSFQYYIFPCVIISWIEYTYMRLSKIVYISVLGLCFYEAIMSENAMLVVAISLITIVSLLKLTRFTIVFNAKVYFSTIIVANILIIFFTTTFLSSSLGSLFLQVFNKGTSLGGRISIIWPTALKYIASKPILGYGVISADAHRNIYNMNAAIHAHNELLEIMFSGGLVCLSLFLIWVLKTLKTVDANGTLVVSRILGFAIFTAFLMAIVEVFSRNIGIGFWLLMYLPNHLQDMDEQYNCISCKE